MKRLILLALFTLPLVGLADDPHSHGHDEHAGSRSLHDIMHGLGAQMLALTYGLVVDDQGAVVRSAAAIAEHAPISHEELERVRRVLGDDMAGFEELDETLHRDAVRLHDAAKAGRTEDVLTRLNELQRTCLACHTQYRDRLEEDHH